MSTETTQRCPTCTSPAPNLHPAMQFEGEVQPCADPWHDTQPTTQPHYPDLDQARVQAAQAARNILAARSLVSTNSVTPYDVIALADWLLGSGVEIDSDDYYVDPENEPAEPEASPGADEAVTE